MSAVKYTYSIQNGFSAHAVDAGRLLVEIRASSISVALDYINTYGDDCDIWFKAELDPGNQAVLAEVVAAHSGEPLPDAEDPKSPSGFPLVMPEPREGSSLVCVTHNWCDPTTWYTGSNRIEGETLSDSGDGKTFGSANENWIDLTHGKIYREDLMSAPYLPVIKVDGVQKTERASWATSGGDFEIDYAAGTVTFFEAQTGVVTTDYSAAASSLFVIAPTAGKRLWVEYSEVQFSRDVDIKSHTHFQPWAYNPADPPNKIAAAAATTYKTLDNYIEEANGCYPVIPAMGGTRGFSQDRMTFPFKYAMIKELLPSYGLEIRVWLEGDVPFGGEYGTATFYCTSRDE